MSNSGAKSLNRANNVRQTAINTAYPLVSQCSHLISNWYWKDEEINCQTVTKFWQKWPKQEVKRYAQKIHKHETFAVLGCYAALFGSLLPTFWDNLSDQSKPHKNTEEQRLQLHWSQSLKPRICKYIHYIYILGRLNPVHTFISCGRRSILVLFFHHIGRAVA
jgi:hypothetical protein